MGRFQLNKGERFTLKKSEGITNLTVSLGWKGGADLDACAFLLGEDGTILDDADFVFYNSNNRDPPHVGRRLCPRLARRSRRRR